MSDELHLALAFDTDSEDFVRGVEVGMLWGRLQHGDESELQQTIHAANAEMVMRIAEAHGAAFTAVDLDDEWVVVTLRRGDADA